MNLLMQSPAQMLLAQEKRNAVKDSELARKLREEMERRLGLNFYPHEKEK